jgi:hypothetical protein
MGLSSYGIRIGFGTRFWTVAPGGSRQRNTGKVEVILPTTAQKRGSQQKGIEIEN